MEKIESLIKDLPDAKSAQRFYSELVEKHPSEIKKLRANKGLLSDLLTLATHSPLLATTILQHPQYISWLKREKKSSNVREKDELLESLARFALTNSQVETNILLARFRRRELIRIYLKDIRGLGTIVEITEEISNLADAILEYALQIARQELDNRYGIPLEIDDKGKAKRAKFCVVALGKLGSKELNYSSDIDLLFLYSNEGTTSGQGSRGDTSNKQYFVKLAEFTSKLVGEQTGEGAAYRVDLRLRPHGRVGALAVSLKEAVNYYKKTSQMWERQVLIRSRASAGDTEIFENFFESVKDYVFSDDETLENALQNVRQSKEKINLEKTAKNGFDVKLGKGGIREIEFIAQALQLAYGGKDIWLRSPHTLISISRLADRNLLSEQDLTELFEAYDFLRRLEHRLQMEHGIQTHFIPDDIEKRLLVSKRMGIFFVADFNNELQKHTINVDKIFKKVFGKEYLSQTPELLQTPLKTPVKKQEKDNLQPILSSLKKSEIEENLNSEKLDFLKTFSEITPAFSEMLTANPNLLQKLPNVDDTFSESDYTKELLSKVSKEKTFAKQLGGLRKTWAVFLLEIVTFEVFEKINFNYSKTLQTKLAEACIETAISITKTELERYFNSSIGDFPFAVLGLGKLGGGGMDYGSDLDLILVYDKDKPCPINNLTRVELYAKAVEFFVTTLSSMTREGSLYRVDLRLRPDGKNGATSIGKNALLNYLNSRAAIWEYLAYVKLRGVSDKSTLAKSIEKKARKIIHQKASEIDSDKLKTETKRIRKMLEKEKSSSRRGKEIDIKFGEGGLQDIYFSIRFLQLRDNIPDDENNRSTLFSLRKLFDNKSLSEKHFENFSEGYKFLSELDHNLRLTIGRSTRLPIANSKALQVISERLKLESVKTLLEKLTFHRLNVRESFEEIFKN